MALENTLLADFYRKISMLFETEADFQLSYETTFNAQLITKHDALLSLIAEAFENNAYQSYLSLISADDPQAALSRMMFLQRAAAYVHKAQNPYATGDSIYHRFECCVKEDVLFKRYVFAATGEHFQSDVQDFTKYLPVTHLCQLSIDELFQWIIDYQQYNQTKRHDEKYSVVYTTRGTYAGKPAFIYLNEFSALEKHFTSCGAKMTLWEMAEYVASYDATLQSNQPMPLDLKKITAIFSLPTTQKKLMADRHYQMLKKFSNNSCYRTALLAAGACHLIETMPSLSSDAISRIGLIMNLVLRFYIKNYDQFAFFIYVIMHEISLAIACESHDVKIKNFHRFYEKTVSHYCNALGLKQNQITTNRLLALPATSGMSAYALCLKLAAEGNPHLKLKLLGSHYFEITGVCAPFIITTEDPDIISFCDGPITDSQGNIFPGIAIETVVQTEIIERNITKPLTLIVDITCNFHENLLLSDKTKALIDAGRLSLILFETRQKFGLLHTDQAQFGYVFAVMGVPLLSHAQWVARAESDFVNHVDMRIGAYMQAAVPNALFENIKAQHFKNAAIYYQLLIRHDVMPAPLFYVSSELKEINAMEKIFGGRHGFGHFEATAAFLKKGIVRVSAGGSDRIDTVIQWIQFMIMLQYDSSSMLELLQAECGHAVFSLQKQVELLGVAMALMASLSTQQKPSEEKLLGAIMQNVLQKCALLKGRVAYQALLSFTKKMARK